jgi:peptidoglycan/LPS O-acetylase OafA/YrhL
LHSGTLRYVPALDGLRGLAVIAVMLYHQRPAFSRGPLRDLTSGGFLGVDVFFVLSGFLITTLLLIDRERTGRVVSTAFWARRARRLLPALFVFLGLLAMYGVVFAEGWELGRLRRGSLATLLYSANYWQLHEPLGAIGIPLGHAWSLGIEEQFYLAWPPLLAVLVWLSGAHRRVLTALVGMLAATSAVLMVVRYDGTDPWRPYLSTETRAHELLIGCALAIWIGNRRGRPSRAKSIVLEAAGTAGLAIVVGMMVTVHFVDGWLYRGGLVLVAVASAACVAAVVQPASRLLPRALSWGPLRAVGIVSYGLYLYHVPVFEVIGPKHTGIRGAALFAVRVTVVGALAAASYVLVERPVRRGLRQLPRTRFLVPAALAVVATLLVAATVGETAVPSRVHAELWFARQSASAPASATRVLVAGDWLAAGLATGTDGSFTGDGIRGVTVSAQGCGITKYPIVIGEAPPFPRYCAQLPDDVRSAVRAFEPDVSVLMAGAVDVFDRLVEGRRLRVGTPELEQHLHGVLEEYRRMLSIGGARFVLLTVPCMRPRPGEVPAPLYAVQRDAARVEWLNGVWRRYAQRHASTVQLADFEAFLCAAGDGIERESWREHGVGLTRSGALATWDWLARVATSATGTAAGRHLIGAA